MSGEKRTTIVLVAKDMASGVIRGVSREMGALGKHVSQGLGTAVKNIERLGIAAAGAAVGGLAASVKVAADFQAQLNIINTIAQTTPDRLTAIGNGIRGLARNTGADLTDLTGSYYDILSAGVKVSDAQAVLERSWKLSTGALGTTNEAVDVLTTALNAYALKGSDATRVSDELAKAVADGKVKLTDIAASYANVAAVAANAKISTTEVAAAYGFLTAKGVPAAEVTTQMSRAIIELLKPGADLLKLQKATKTSYADLAAEKGLSVALQQMRQDAAAANIPFINLFGRMEGYKYALQTTGDNAAAFAAELDRIKNSAGTLDDQVSERTQGLSYTFGRLKAIIKDTGITIGTALLPSLTRLAQRVADFVTSHQADITAFAEKLGTDLGNFFDRIDTGKLTALAGVVRSIASAGRDLVSAFMGAPAWLQQLLVGGFAVNKLTGGMVTNIGADLVKGMLRGLGTLGGKLLPGPLGAVAGAISATPVFVTNWPAGGLGIPGTGGAGGAVTAAAGAGVAAFVAAAGGIAAVIAMAGLAAADLVDPSRRTTNRYSNVTRSGWLAPNAAAPATDRAYADYRAGERGDRTPAAALAIDRAFQEYRAGERGDLMAIKTAVERQTGQIVHSPLFRQAANIRREQNAPLTGPLLRRLLGTKTASPADLAVLAQAEAIALANNLAKIEAPAKDASDLRSAQRNIKDLVAVQRRIAATGDTRTASRIAASIDALRAAIRAAEAQINVTVNVKTFATARDTEQAQVFRRRSTGQLRVVAF